MSFRSTWVWRGLVAAQCLLAVLGVRQWLYASTYRLYLDPTAAQASAGLSRQRFEIVGDRVQPQVLSAPGDRVSFPVAIPEPTELRVRAVPSGAAVLEIAALRAGRRDVLRRVALTGASEIRQPVPPLAGRLELSGDAAVEWLDPRLVREPSLVPKLAASLVLAGAMLALRPRRRTAPGPVDRRRLLAGLTLGLTALACLGLAEGALRLMGARLPGWIAAQRRELGERQPDPRWQDSPRYGSRLAAGARTFCEWEQGDIVRMGFLPPGLVRHAAYRFPFVTDAEGFRNAAAPSADEPVAALGDSFTDAMTLPAELGWPSRLEPRLGAGVRNYGTAGFGPQQELLALREFALPRRPRLVVVAFFAGNDLQDAERFANLARDGRHPSSTAGWRFKPVIARFDTLYLVSLTEGLRGLWRDTRAPALPAVHAAETPDFSGEDPAAPAQAPAAFERGLFTVPVNGRALRFAFLPPYLNALRYSADALRGSRRFALTREAYREMHAAASTAGSQLVVMFIPSKAQLYLPLLAEAFTPAQREAALRAVLKDDGPAPEYATLMAHRLALNGVMRELCAAEGIPFLDLTPSLAARVAAGTNLYFPDDSHWNAAGHEAAAVELAGWLAARGFSGRSPGRAALPGPLPTARPTAALPPGSARAAASRGAAASPGPAATGR